MNVLQSDKQQEPLELRDILMVQCPILVDAPDRNRLMISELLGKDAVPAGSLIVLPELCTTGLPCAGTNSPPVLDPARVFEDDAAFYKGLAVGFKAFVLGATTEPCGTKRANASLLVSPEGKISLTYRKVHLMNQIGEDQQFAAGSSLGLAWVGSTRLLTTICYDLRFPELYRKGAEEGCEVITVQANWPAARQDHWDALLVARAIENQAWVVGVNRVGTHQSPFGPIQYRGGSLVVSPLGEIVARGGEGPEVVRARIGWAELETCRRQFEVLRDRRFIIEDLDPARDVARA
jgi:omega-amidase